eukprot:1277657-Amphidinium_carterae.1
MGPTATSLGSRAYPRGYPTRSSGSCTLQLYSDQKSFLYQSVPSVTCGRVKSLWSHGMTFPRPSRQLVIPSCRLPWFVRNLLLNFIYVAIRASRSTLTCWWCTLHTGDADRQEIRADRFLIQLAWGSLVEYIVAGDLYSRFAPPDVQDLCQVAGCDAMSWHNMRPQTIAQLLDDIIPPHPYEHITVRTDGTATFFVHSSVVDRALINCQPQAFEVPSSSPTHPACCTKNLNFTGFRLPAVSSLEHARSFLQRFSPATTPAPPGPQQCPKALWSAFAVCFLSQEALFQQLQLDDAAKAL